VCYFWLSNELVANLRQKPIDQLFRSHDGVLCRTLHLTPTEAEVGWKRTVCHLNDQMIDLSSKGPTDLTSWMSLDGLDLPYVARPKLSGPLQIMLFVKCPEGTTEPYRKEKKKESRVEGKKFYASLRDTPGKTFSSQSKVVQNCNRNCID
jgi:DnaJ-class molecular chaperone